MRVLLSTNCQSAGIAEALYRMARLKKVHSVPLVKDEPYESFRQRLQPDLRTWDAIVVGAGPSLHFARRLLDETGARPRLLIIPEVVFDAFHPDLTYATVVSTGRMVEPWYQSAIGLWLFNRRIEPSVGARAFCETVYRALGYLDRWSGAVDHLRCRFKGTDLEPHFPEFFLAIKRRGCFMHTLNHPKVHVLARLAELIARELGLQLSSPLAQGELDDGLDSEVWPVYPEIAEVLGVPGAGYRWQSKARQLRIEGVSRYLGVTFRELLKQGIKPGEVQAHEPVLQDFDLRMARVASEVL